MFWWYKREVAGSSISSLSFGFPEVTGRSGFLSNQYFDIVSCWRKWRVPLGSLFMCVCVFILFLFILSRKVIHISDYCRKKIGKSFLQSSHRIEGQCFGIRGGRREFFLKFYSDDLVYPHGYLFSIEVIWFHFWEHRLPQNKTDFCFVLFLCIDLNIFALFRKHLQS